MNNTLEGYHMAEARLKKDGMLDCNEIDAISQELCKKDGADMYDVAGDLINALMTSHPTLSYGWKRLSADARWVFIHDMHYGIEGGIRQHMGMRTVYEEDFPYATSDDTIEPECSYEHAMKVIK